MLVLTAHTPNSLFALLVATMLLAGCASNAPYYKPRKQKGCDCPKWNALPMKPGAVSVQVAPCRPEFVIKTEIAN